MLTLAHRREDHSADLGLFAASAAPQHASDDGLVGRAIGSISRRYGLMVCEEIIRVTEVVARSGDLAVADRLAFLAASERGDSVLVVGDGDGWFSAVRTEGVVDPHALGALQPASSAPRVFSLATRRGITPLLGSLGGAAAGH